MFFASDNTSGAPAPVMQALVQANAGYARSYGNDDIMARATAQMIASPEDLAKMSENALAHARSIFSIEREAWSLGEQYKGLHP